jgi:large subunit ribosomal protein L25
MSIELKAENREQFGRALKSIREKGLIPAELYGYGLKNEHLAVTKKDFLKVFKKAGESTMIDLMVGGKKHPVMIHDVTVDPVSDEVMSIDFYQVRLDKKIQIKVPVVYVGESPAVKEKQGVLVKAMNEVKVEALPTDIPRTIEIDLALLTDIGVDIHISDLKLGGSVRVLEDPAFVIATVTARMTEEEEAKLAAVADVTEIKTEGEEKKAEREAKAGDAVDAAAPAAEPAKK